MHGIKLTAFSAFAASFSTLALVSTLARRTITSLTQTDTTATFSSFTLVTTALTVGAAVAVSCAGGQRVKIRETSCTLDRQGRIAEYIIENIIYTCFTHTHHSCKVQLVYPPFLSRGMSN